MVIILIAIGGYCIGEHWCLLINIYINGY
jgi:hypothetical protein